MLERDEKIKNSNMRQKKDMKHTKYSTNISLKNFYTH